MRKTPPNNTPRSTETRFSPPAFPPKAGKANHIVRVSKNNSGIGQRDVRFAQVVLMICVIIGMFGTDFPSDLSSGF